MLYKTSLLEGRAISESKMEGVISAPERSTFSGGGSPDSPLTQGATFAAHDPLSHALPSPSSELEKSTAFLSVSQTHLDPFDLSTCQCGGRERGRRRQPTSTRPLPALQSQ